MDDNNNQENNNRGFENLFEILKFCFKKWPSETVSFLSAAAAAIGHVLVVFFVIIFVFFGITMVVESFSSLIQGNSSVGEWTNSFGEKVGNLFSGFGFTSDSEAASRAETQYYQKLQQVYNKYYDLYGVEIDTTMITATLMAGRDSSLVTEESFDGDMFSDQASFYKQAKNHINTLAKYQLVLAVTANFCTDGDASYHTYPNDAREIANNWVSVNGSSWSTRLTVNNVPNSDNIIACDYVDAEDALRGNSVTNTRYETYSNTRQKYLDAKTLYDSCLESEISKAEDNKKDECITDACSSCDSYDESSDAYQSCNASCGSTCSGDLTDSELNDVTTSANAISCRALYEDYTAKRDILKSTWLASPNDYFEDIDDICGPDDGCHTTPMSGSKNLSSESEFYCISTGTYQAFESYSDANKYRNYMPEAMGLTSNLSVDGSSFNDVINQIRNNTSRLCSGEECANTMCSRKPSVEMGYSIDNFDKEGIYYWKLLSNMNRSGQINFDNVNVDTDGSFIKQYFFHDKATVSEELLINKVDEIFGVYNSVAEKRRTNTAFEVHFGEGTIQVPAGDDVSTVVSGVSSLDPIGLSNSAQGMGTLKYVYGRDYEKYWGPNNRYYAGNNIIQCTGYAYGRALEILLNAGMSLEETKTKAWNALSGNAGMWFEANSRTQAFSSSTNVNEPRVGAVIVWSDNSVGNKYSGCGHVAIVEKIVRDENGKISSLVISEGGEGLNGFRYVQKELSYIKKHGSQDFIGYIYLLNY